MNINGKEYELDDLTNEQKELVDLIAVGNQSHRLLEFIIGSVALTREIKYKQLVESLESDSDEDTNGEDS